MTISKTRSLLYSLARWLGNISAAKRGRVGERVANRAIGRGANKILRKLWR